MFEHLKTERVVLVTGPQRSGTRICAKMIAHDTGHTYVDEFDFGITEEKRFYQYQYQDNVVIQCPAMLPYCLHEQHALVVFMRRPVEDIIKSQDRIDWTRKHEQGEKSYYVGDQPDPRPVSVIKYDRWDKQKPGRYLEVDYNSLCEHELWIPQEHRQDFIFCQTTIGELDK